MCRDLLNTVNANAIITFTDSCDPSTKVYDPVQ